MLNRVRLLLFCSPFAKNNPQEIITILARKAPSLDTAF
ncbi:MAG: hypothetical protein ACI9IJ_000936 [Psychromonas sp.]|jgi:hypothetical protein